MNDEPTYEYVKGVGWTPTQNGTFCIAPDGKRLSLIRRNPEPGDRYFAIRPPETLESILKVALERYRATPNGVISGVYFKGQATNPVDMWRDYILVTFVIE